jgi:hypothetical protein
MMSIYAKRIPVFVIAIALSLMAVSCGTKTPEATRKEDVKTTASAQPSACNFPTTMAGSNEQTAWQLFVAANCLNNGKLTWETWTEQTCIFSSSACPPAAAAAATPAHHLHGSHLAAHKRGVNLKANALPSSDCSPMNTAGPFAPKNLSASPKFCEEVYANPEEVSFIRQPGAQATLTTYAGQVSWASDHQNAIATPNPSIEIKVDWLPATSLASNGFDCTNPPAGLYVENISGTCYAMVGIHLSSKLLPNWLWATFEPQNAGTNPNRCNPDLYNACNDPWGSNPAASTGADTAATQALIDLMTQAGLPKAFQNYRLVAAQTAFLDSNNQPTQLGNSFVEFNADVQPHQASCITCHAYATLNPPASENSCCTFKAMIGTPNAAQQKKISQDFSWMIGFGPGF